MMIAEAPWENYRHHISHIIVAMCVGSTWKWQPVATKGHEKNVQRKKIQLLTAQQLEIGE
jgi:hypothetical protein